MVGARIFSAVRKKKCAVGGGLFVRGGGGVRACAAKVAGFVKDFSEELKFGVDRRQNGNIMPPLTGKGRSFTSKGGAKLTAP